MNAVEAFHRTILDQPDADAPRLVFADWLEEQCEPLAELVRVQCEITQLRDADPRKEELRRQEAGLLERFQSHWFGPLHEMGLTGRFRRGFMEVTLNGIGAFVELTERICRLPWVLQCNIRDSDAGLAAVQSLVASPHLRRIRSLDLSRSKIGNRGLEILGSAEGSFRPTALHFNSSNISSRGVQALVHGVDLSRLVELRLSTNGIGEQGALDLSRCTKCVSLRTLDLSFNRLGSIGGEYLAESRVLNRLQALYVRGSSIGPRGKRALRRRFGPRVHIGNASLPF
jgi:uncharacterized protein (TIGR02996 family)